MLRALTLRTDRLDEVRRFYHETLGLPLIESGEGFVVFQVGGSRLRFERSAEPATYHFAVNIPHRQIKEMADWLAARTDVLPPGVVTFENWGAKAVYFTDPASNIVELIDREETTGTERFVGISEIGIVVEDVEGACLALRNEFSLPVYKETKSPDFTALGGPDGLLIVVQEGRVWYPTTDVRARAHPLEVEIGGQAGRGLELASAYRLAGTK